MDDVLKVKSVANERTTEIIDSFMTDQTSGYTSMLLEDAFTLRIHEKELYIHLRVSSLTDGANVDSAPSMTFTHYKKYIADRVFDAYTCNMDPLSQLVLGSLSKSGEILEKEQFDFDVVFPKVFFLDAQSTDSHKKFGHGNTYRFCFVGARVTSLPLNEQSARKLADFKAFAPKRVSTVTSVGRMTKNSIPKRLKRSGTNILFVKDAFCYRLSPKKRIYVSVYLLLEKSDSYSLDNYDFEDCKKMLFGKTFDVRKPMPYIPKTIFSLLVNPDIDFDSEKFDKTIEVWNKISFPLDRINFVDFVIKAVRVTSSPLKKKRKK